MKTFTVEEEVFERLPDYCLGVVIAEGIDNRGAQPAIANQLDGSVREFAERFAGQDVRELPNVKAYREAFRSLDMNPNKFMCSI